jgi:hypothetical protein
MGQCLAEASLQTSELAQPGALSFFKWVFKATWLAYSGEGKIPS